VKEGVRKKLRAYRTLCKGIDRAAARCSARRRQGQECSDHAVHRPVMCIDAAPDVPPPIFPSKVKSRCPIEAASSHQSRNTPAKTRFVMEGGEPTVPIGPSRAGPLP
jgi:hypothetical protein